MEFRYIAETTDGKVTQGALTAESEQAAVCTLHARSLLPIDVRPKATIRNTSTRSLSTQTVRGLISGLGQLLTSGVPLPDALRLMANRDSKIGAVAAILLQSVRSGNSLADAAGELPHALPAEVHAIIGIGEETGSLGPLLSRLASELSERQSREREIIGQLIYPAALFVLMIGTVFFLAHFILPEFAIIYQNGTTEPPPETAAVLATGEFIRDWGWSLPGLVLFGMLSMRWSITSFPLQTEKILLRAPLFGWFARQRNAARFCRGLGVLLSSGADLATALPIARRPVGLKVLRDAHAEAADQIRGGMALASSFDAKNLVPTEALELITLGEQSGRLGPMLIEAAQLIEIDINTRLKRFAALTGPVLTALMGLLTAGVIAAVMGGVLNLNEAIY